MPKIKVNPRCKIVKQVRAFFAKHLSAIQDHLGVIRWRRQVLRSLKRRRKC